MIFIFPTLTLSLPPWLPLPSNGENDINHSRLCIPFAIEKRSYLVLCNLWGTLSVTGHGLGYVVTTLNQVRVIEQEMLPWLTITKVTAIIIVVIANAMKQIMELAVSMAQGLFGSWIVYSHNAFWGFSSFGSQVLRMHYLTIHSQNNTFSKLHFRDTIWESNPGEAFLKFCTVVGFWNCTE